MLKGIGKVLNFVLKCCPTNLIVLLGERALLVGDQTTGRIMDGWERGSSDHSIMMLLIGGHEYVGGYWGIGGVFRVGVIDPPKSINRGVYIIHSSGSRRRSAMSMNSWSKVREGKDLNLLGRIRREKKKARVDESKSMGIHSVHNLFRKSFFFRWTKGTRS